MPSGVKKTHDKANMLNPSNQLYKQWIYWATTSQLRKDAGRGDATTNILFKKRINKKAAIVANESGILAGRQEIEFFLSQYRDVTAKFFINDGHFFRKKQIICELNGNLGRILAIERIVLNVLGRMSGIATQTKKIIDRVSKINNKIIVTPTRKTLWGLLDKRACSVAGAGTHRLTLSDAVIVKDNHLDAINRNLEKAILCFSNTRKNISFIEIEVDSVEEAVQAATVFSDLKKKKKNKTPFFIMLDNFTPKMIKKTFEELKKRKLRNGIGMEVSGGINAKNISSYAKTDVDVISMGSLTHSARMSDLSMKISKV